MGGYLEATGQERGNEAPRRLAVREEKASGGRGSFGICGSLV